MQQRDWGNDAQAYRAVSILTGSEEPVQLAGLFLRLLWRRFQSSPAPKSRCNDHDLCLFTADGVSILTGSEEPVQPGRKCLRARGKKFQSSPAPKSRCNAHTKTTRTWISGFNPHRLRRAGATGRLVPPPVVAEVSILTGSEEPVQRKAKTVTIVLPLFQSSPAPKSRCN